MLFFVWAIRRSETGVCSEKRDGDAQWFSERMFWLVQRRPWSEDMVLSPPHTKLDPE